MLHNNMGFPTGFNQMNAFPSQFPGGNGTSETQYPYGVVPPIVSFHQDMTFYPGPYRFPVDPIHMPGTPQTPMPPTTYGDKFPLTPRRVGIKRKASDIGLESLLPVKLRIDEAKMTESMNGLQLQPNANNNSSMTCSEVAPWHVMEQDNHCSVDSMESMDITMEVPSNGKMSSKSLNDLGENATLEIKDEFKLHFRSRELLPKSIIDEIVKPCLQLVLWKPPEEGILGDLKKGLKRAGKKSSTKDEGKDGTGANSTNHDVKIPDTMMSEELFDFTHEVDMDP